MKEDKKILTAPTEIKLSKETVGEFEGYASIFGSVDGVGDVVHAGAFKRTLKGRDKMPPLLWQHMTDQPIGKIIDLYEDDKGLYMKGQLFVDDIVRAKEAYKLMVEGVVDSFSIGYRTVDSDYDDNYLRHLRDVDLLEVSVVTFPANDKARMSSVKAQAIKTEREFENFLREEGFSRSEAKAITSNGFKAVQGQREAVEDDDVAELSKTLAGLFKS